MNTCESNVENVESKGEPGIVSSTWSAAATECLMMGANYSEQDVTLGIYEIGAYEARSATTSAELKPASAKRSRMAVMVSKGSGTSRSGAGAVASGRPSMNSRRGAPAQFEKPTAPANWILKERG